VKDFFAWIERNSLYACYKLDDNPKKPGRFIWDFSGITEHIAHNLYDEFDYYAHKAMSCRKFGAELRWFEKRPEELPRLPPDEKASLLDYLKDKEKGSKYAKEIHGGVLLHKFEKPEKSPDGPTKAEVWSDRVRVFLKAVNLDTNWKVPLDILYYTFFLAIKDTDWYNAEKVKMAPRKLFDEYTEENSKLGEEFIKYILFKNFDRMDTEYFKIADYLKKHRIHFPNEEDFQVSQEKDWSNKNDGLYENYIKEMKRNYMSAFIYAYRKKIDETMESFPAQKERIKTAEATGISLRDTEYLPWNLEELINRISMQKPFLYAVGAERKLTEAEKGNIGNWYTEIKKTVQEVIAELSEDKAETLSKTLDSLIYEAERKASPNSPRDYDEILKLEYKLITDSQVREKIKGRIFNSIWDLCTKKRIVGPIGFREEIKTPEEIGTGSNTAELEDGEIEKEQDDQNEIESGVSSTGYSESLHAADQIVDAYQKEFPLLVKYEKVRKLVINFIAKNFTQEEQGEARADKLRHDANGEMRKQLIDYFLEEYRKSDTNNPDDDVKNQIDKLLDAIIKEC
jgi:hypothetical protein